MQLTHRLFRKKSGIYFCENRVTGRQESLHTRDKGTGVQLLNAKNEAHRQPMLNRQIARAYLAGLDSGVVIRTWQDAMDEAVATKSGVTQVRWEGVMRDKAFNLIRL